MILTGSLSRFRKARTCVPGSYRKLGALALIAATILMLGTILVPSKTVRVLAAQAEDFPTPSQLASEIRSKFPDRKTGTPACRDFLQSASLFLREYGWFTDGMSYSVMMRSQDHKGTDITFMKVSGDNLLATRVPAASIEIIDLLVVAPYDTLFAENPHEGIYPSHTCGAAGILLALAGQPNGAKDGIALALVSGHHQYGAGIESLLYDLVSRRGIRINAAMVIGDVWTTHGVALVPNGNPPAGMVAQVYNACRQAGLSVFLAGEKWRSAWYLESTRPPVTYPIPQAFLDKGDFLGEGESIAKVGIPTVTVGLPRSYRPFPSQDRVVETKTAGIAQAFDLLLAPSSLDQSLTCDGPGALDMVLVPFMGKLLIVPAVSARTAAAVVFGVGLLVLFFCRDILQELGRLALLAGAFLACLLAHMIRALCLAIGNTRYPSLAYPGRSIMLYVLLVALLILLGFLRIWSVRTRIYNLHTGAETAVTAAPRGASGKEHFALGNAWGLAVMTAVLAGLTIAGPQLAPFACVSVLALCIGLVLEAHQRTLGKLSTGVLWLERVLGLVPAVMFFTWAGLPWNPDSQAAYLSTWQRLSPENMSLTLAFAVSICCFLSTLKFPRPLPKSRQGVLRMSEVMALACLLCACGFFPKSLPANVPVSALVQEFAGSDTQVTVTAMRPLGNLALEVQPSPSSSESARNVQDRTGSVSLRLPGVNTTKLTSLSHSLSLKEDRNTSKSEVLEARVQASFPQLPTFYVLSLKDSPYGRGTQSPFMLEDVTQILGETEMPSEDSFGIVPKPGYSLRVVWWQPAEEDMVTLFSFRSGLGSRAVITSQAVYLDNPMVDLSLEAENAAFFRASMVTAQSSR